MVARQTSILEAHLDVAGSSPAIGFLQNLFLSVHSLLCNTHRSFFFFLILWENLIILCIRLIQSSQPVMVFQFNVHQSLFNDLY